MLKIGITGGIGSGKTTICQIFETFGIPVFYADTVAKQIMYTDNKLKLNIQKAFGEDVYTTQGDLNRKHLASMVFNNVEKLNILNSLVHPAVYMAFDNWVICQTNTPYVIKEAALLFESESYKMCHYTVLVKSPVNLKTPRIMQRDGISLDEVNLRMSRQFTDNHKEEMANFIVLNNEQKLLVPQVVNLHEHFIKLEQMKQYDYR